MHQRVHPGAQPYRCTLCVARALADPHLSFVTSGCNGDPAPLPGVKPRPWAVWTAFACLSGDGDSEQILSPQRTSASRAPSFASSVPSLPPPPWTDPCSMRIMGWQLGIESKRAVEWQRSTMELNLLEEHRIGWIVEITLVAKAIRWRNNNS